MSFEDGTHLAARAAVLFFSPRRYAGATAVAVRAAVVAAATATMHASNITFYQYEGRALDHGWLHNCAGFHALRHGASDRFIQEQGLTHSLRRGTGRPCPRRRGCPPRVGARPPSPGS